MRFLDLPPLWLVLCLALAWAIPPHFAHGGAAILGWGFVALGVVLTFAAVVEFWRARTTIIPRNSPDALITGGVFRLSRNPIYLADVLVLLGLSLVWGAVLGLVLVPVFAMLLRRRFIDPEEAVLRQAFGETFEAYAARTRRWF